MKKLTLLLLITLLSNLAFAQLPPQTLDTPEQIKEYLLGKRDSTEEMTLQMESWTWQDTLRLTVLGFNTSEEDTVSTFTLDTYLYPMKSERRNIPMSDEIFIICSLDYGSEGKEMDVCFGLLGQGRCIFDSGGIQTVSFKFK